MRCILIVPFLLVFLFSALSRVGLNSMSFRCLTFAQDLRSSTGFLKVGELVTDYTMKDSSAIHIVMSPGTRRDRDQLPH